MTHPHSGTADFVTSGGQWTGGGFARSLGQSGGTVTWSVGAAGLFDDTGSNFFSAATVELTSFLPFDFKSVLQQAFDAWSHAANIDFVQVNDAGGDMGEGVSATIRIVGGFIDGQSGSNVLARAFFPSSSPAGGDIVFDSGNTTFYSNANSFYLTALHEIGHSIGLEHELASSALAVMNPTINLSLFGTGPFGSGLQQDDINGARAIYGPAVPDLPTYGTGWLALGVGDRTGDGSADIIWRATNDQVKWGSTSLGIISADWQVEGVADSNGDSTQEILWRHVNGETKWGNSNLGVISSSWDLAGLGDSNGDGQLEMVWRSVNGETKWGNYNLGSISTVWQLEGIGDSDGDGRDEILWRNVNGETKWGNYNLGSISTVWQVEGIGDWDGDGRDDILWRHVNGETKWGNFNIGNIDDGWRLAGIGDWDGDGRDQFVWQHITTGAVSPSTLAPMSQAAVVASDEFGPHFHDFWEQTELADHAAAKATRSLPFDADLGHVMDFQGQDIPLAHTVTAELAWLTKDHCLL